jgi:hypothetical protein
MDGVVEHGRTGTRQIRGEKTRRFYYVQACTRDCFASTDKRAMMMSPYFPVSIDGFKRPETASQSQSEHTGSDAIRFGDSIFRFRKQV